MLPAGVRAFAHRGPEWAQFVDRLPKLAGEVVGEWDLTPDGDAVHGWCALVLPMRTRDGVPAVLKLHFPDEESEHEHLALRRWAGDGAVRLLRADPHRHALLLERLHARDVETLPDLASCEVAARLYARLHVPAMPSLRTLSSYVERWDADLMDLPRSAPLPRRLVEQAHGLATAFLEDPATDATVVHGDLHGKNILAADREPWLAIDPKPVNGDPHYEPAPLLWNRWEEAAASASLRQAVRRRFHTIVDTAGLDEDRARDWVVVRMVHNAMWTIREAAGPLTTDERDWLTCCVTIAKAVQE